MKPRVDENYRRNLDHQRELKLDPDAVKLGGSANLRTSTFEGEVTEEMLFQELKEDVFEIKRWVDKIGLALVDNSVKKFCKNLGLSAEATLKEIIIEANDKRMLFQHNGLITMAGLQLIAAYINKLPLIDPNTSTMRCICGAEHKFFKSKKGKTIQCKKLKIKVHSHAWTKLSLVFYGALLEYIIKHWKLEINLGEDKDDEQN